MEKSRKRAERRWRGFHAWMRRLQSDWWEHGSRIDPRSVYRHWKESGGACSLRRDGTRFFGEPFGCPCFDLTHKGAYTFKNHPTGTKSNAAYRKDDDWYGYTKKEPYKVAKKQEAPERVWPSGRAKKRKIRDWKIQCRRCGYLIDIAREMTRDEADAYTGKFFGNPWYTVCYWCDKRARAYQNMVADAAE